MSIHGLHLLKPPGIQMAILNNLPPEPPRYHYDDLDGDPDDINIRRRRERWHTIEWTSREDDRRNPSTGERYWPEGSDAMMYDEELDWILNGVDTMTFQEWEDNNRPMAINAKPVGPPNRVRRETLMDYL